jgi:hypothetical protein
MPTPTTPTAMTYDSLKQSIINYTEVGSTNTTFTDELPRIINRAERSICDKLKIQGYRDVVTSKMTAQQPVIAKPQGWRATVSINFGISNSGNVRQTLRNRAYEYLRRIYPNDSQYDAPVLYADYNEENWIVAPTPDQAYPFEAIIYRLPGLLSESNQSNFLTDLIPNYLLYKCLVATEPFLKNDSRLPTWQQLLADEEGSVTQQDIMKMMDRALRRTTS